DQGVRVQGFARSLVERGFTLGVGAVGDHDDGALAFGALREGLGGLDYRVVKRRLVAGFHIPDGLGRVARLAEILQHFYFEPAEPVDRDHVAVSQLREEIATGRARQREFVPHASARVEQDGGGERRLFDGEIEYSLRGSVFQNLEILDLEAGDV